MLQSLKGTIFFLALRCWKIFFFEIFHPPPSPTQKSIGPPPMNGGRMLIFGVVGAIHCVGCRREFSSQNDYSMFYK